MTGSMNARSHHLFPVLLLTALSGVLTANGIGAAEPKDDWQCAQAADTGRWSCARDGVTADAAIESAAPAAEATRAPQETSTPLPDIQSEAITPAASNSGEPLDSESGTPIESVAADAVAPVETPPLDDVFTTPAAQEAPPSTAPSSTASSSTDPTAPVAIEPEQPETASTPEPAVVEVPVVDVPVVDVPVIDVPVDEVPVTETPADLETTDLETTPDPEPAPAAVAVDPNAPDFQRLAYVPDKPTSLLDLPGEFWVAQIMAVSSKEFLETYAEEHNLRGLSAARIASGERLFFVLILGIYETKDRAQQAITNLPPPYHKYKPLLRNLASLQQAMRKADKMTGTADF